MKGWTTTRDAIMPETQKEFISRRSIVVVYLSITRWEEGKGGWTQTISSIGDKRLKTTLNCIRLLVSSHTAAPTTVPGAVPIDEKRRIRKRRLQKTCLDWNKKIKQRKEIEDENDVGELWSPTTTLNCLLVWRWRDGIFFDLYLKSYSFWVALNGSFVKPLCDLLWSSCATRFLWKTTSSQILLCHNQNHSVNCNATYQSAPEMKVKPSIGPVNRASSSASSTTPWLQLWTNKSNKKPGK